MQYPPLVCSAMSPRSRQQLRAVLLLRELILAGELAPGERIPELTAVAKLGMSRTPVRLALTTLEHEGLLQNLAGGGFMVRDFSLSDISDAIELRGVLEGTAARFAAERHRGPDSLRSLGAVVDQMDALLEREPGPGTFEGYVELNETFHAQLLELAQSSMLRRSLAQVMHLPFASPNAFLQVQSEAPQSRPILVLGQDQHRALLEAIGAREGARAEALAREHARLARRNLGIVLERRELLQQVPGAALIRRELDELGARLELRPATQPAAESAAASDGQAASAKSKRGATDAA
jgi:GntR family transcriptional regulator, vanillate catabolism transcriptional regulator